MIQDFNKKNIRNQRSQNNQSLKQSVNQNKNKNQRSQNNSRNISVNVTKEPIKLTRKQLLEIKSKNNFYHRKPDNNAYNP